MSVVVENTFGFQLVDLMQAIINTFINFWNVANYTFFTIPLEWLNEVINLPIDSPFYFQDFDVNFISCITSGLVVILLIHIIKLLISN